ncbi:hypothetical protein [Streptomyces sp. HC307]|uniref:hypothetical protein n=1 Tax=Streptomyces flavusporus TaxID=3385496 RepID=UPI003916FE01
MGEFDHELGHLEVVWGAFGIGAQQIGAHLRPFVEVLAIAFGQAEEVGDDRHRHHLGELRDTVDRTLLDDLGDQVPCLLHDFVGARGWPGAAARRRRRSAARRVPADR